MSSAYFISGGSYARYNTASDQIDAGYPKALANGWSGIVPTGFADGFDSGIDLGSGKLFLFKGSEYIRIDQQSNTVDGANRSIAEAWGGFADAGFTDSIDAAINWGDGNAYFFRGDSYIQYDIATDAVVGGPASIAGNWPGLAEAGFGDGLDAAVMWDSGVAYFFKGNAYVRYTPGVGADEGYPLATSDGWAALAGIGFDVVDAAWIKLTTGGGGGGGGGGAVGALGPGDHLWYYNGQISTDKNVPRAAWFPGSNPADPNDYQNHGVEIFHYVIHAGGQIYAGQPHLRNRPGTFAWLNNNPGNLTGQPGGPDYGQYANKFNWHNFLIFPSADVGYNAIAALLRGPGYRDLDILAAFRRYAPASDGNTPDVYAAQVAAAAGVPQSTRVGDLDDAQMSLMQDKIREIEGARAGQVLTRDDPNLPDAVRAALA